MEFYIKTKIINKYPSFIHGQTRRYMRGKTKYQFCKTSNGKRPFCSFKTYISVSEQF